jgi:hypothetical protein
MCGNGKVSLYKNFSGKNKPPLILIYVIDLKKVAYKGTEIRGGLFLPEKFLFWASPPYQGIRTLRVLLLDRHYSSFAVVEKFIKDERELKLIVKGHGGVCKGR